jgi:hypothetical protein
MSASPPGEFVPWAPEDLPIRIREFEHWTYVVLEEIVDNVALLRRWPWPVVDGRGRLLWPGGAEHDTDAIAVDLQLLEVQLYTPNGIERQPRCGDTFAVPRSTANRWRARRLRDLRDALGHGSVYDISADAREAAKIAYQASLGAIRPAEKPDRASISAVEAELARRKRRRLRPLRLGAPPSPVAARQAGR